MFSGDGIPDQAGTVATVNYNGDAADIYGNLNLDPDFVDLDSSEDFSFESPLVNGGDVDSLDLDATIADIGANFYNFGYAPFDLTVTSIGEEEVSLSWNIIATDTLTGYQPYFRKNVNADWTAFEFPATDTVITITNLENNELYDFAITALYVTSESRKSKISQCCPRCSCVIIT